jgi:hypothetical protein
LEDGRREPGIYTTHCSPRKRPKLIGQPVIINNRRAIAYMKGEEVESYVLWDEAQEKLFKDDIPRITVGF